MSDALRKAMDSHIEHSMKNPPPEPPPNPNSSNIWLPVVERSGVPTPKTISIPYNHLAITPIFDGQECHDFRVLTAKVMAACQHIGYPCFIRTDLSSAKHSGPSSYLAKDDPDVARVLAATLEDNELKFWPSTRPTAILVREFLHLEHEFTAFHGLPISREWRLFVAPEGMQCAHPYWPLDAFKYEDVDDIERRIADLAMRPDNLDELAASVLPIVQELGGEWSVDLSKDIHGIWWLTDMATAQDSYHHPECTRK